jgi:Rod binding domain-containing protein
MLVNQIENSRLNIALGTPKTLSPEQKKLKQTCTEFESLMVRQMLDSMEGSTKMFGDGFGGDFYQGMFLDAISKQISEQGLGLGKMMYQQLDKTNNAK